MEEKNKDEMYMRMALAEAQKAFDKGEIPIGAIVVCKDRIIARAYNLTETLIDVTAHAEMQAITMAANMLGGKYLTDCTLYVTVEPCPMCAGAMINSRIRALYFGAYDEKTGAAGSKVNLFEEGLFNHDIIVSGGHRQEECAALLSDFFKNKRKNRTV